MQGELEWRPHTKARRENPGTSKAAAQSAEPVARRHHRLIHVALESMQDGTPEEIADACGLDAHRIGKRLHELEKSGVIVTTGETRAHRSGRQARVWRLTDAGA